MTSLFQIEPLVGGTVIMMTVLVAADDRVDDFGDATGLILGPMTAAALADLFAAYLGHVTHRRRAPAGSDLRHILVQSSQFLWLTVIPLSMLLVGRVTGAFSAETVLDNIVDFGFLLLVGFGALGGWHCATVRWRGAALGATAAALIGLVTVVLKAVLEN